MEIIWGHTWWRSVKLLFERLNHWRGEGLAFLPDIDELLNLFLHGGEYVSYGPKRHTRMGRVGIPWRRAMLPSRYTGARATKYGKSS